MNWRRFAKFRVIHLSSSSVLASPSSHHTPNISSTVWPNHRSRSASGLSAEARALAEGRGLPRQLRRDRGRRVECLQDPGAFAEGRERVTRAGGAGGPLAWSHGQALPRASSLASGGSDLCRVPMEVGWGWRRSGARVLEPECRHISQGPPGPWPPRRPPWKRVTGKVSLSDSHGLACRRTTRGIATRIVFLRSFLRHVDKASLQKQRPSGKLSEATSAAENTRLDHDLSDIWSRLSGRAVGGRMARCDSAAPCSGGPTAGQPRRRQCWRPARSSQGHGCPPPGSHLPPTNAGIALWGELLVSHLLYPQSAFLSRGGKKASRPSGTLPHGVHASDSALQR